jgi:hypothetical protein
MTLSDMQAQLDALLAARFRGVRATNYDGKSVTYGSDAEMARAIADLEARIAAMANGPRSRLTKIYASKGL